MESRAEKLRRAESLLNEAADLMDEALRMSGMELRSGNDSDLVRRIASDPRYGGSLRNIAKDLEYADAEQPCWTLPLTSPKHVFDRNRAGRSVFTSVFQSKDDGRPWPP